MKVYGLIEDVLRKAAKPLTEFEFANVSMELPMQDSSESRVERVSGRQYVGCTESTLGRRLREMRKAGRVSAKKRDGKQYVEYALVKKTAEFPAETVAA